MQKNQSRVLALLFKPEPSPNYQLLAVVLCVVGLGLVFSPASTWPKHLLMGGVWLGISRIFDTEWMRVLWLATFALLALVLVLDVAVGLLPA